LALQPVYLIFIRLLGALALFLRRNLGTGAVTPQATVRWVTAAAVPTTCVATPVGGTGLWVPTTSSTSCDLGVFVDDATEAITPPDLELV
jgi:hypothetical protein